MAMILGNVNFQIVFVFLFSYMSYSYISLFSVTYGVGTHWNCLYEAIPMCTYNICLFNK